MARTFKDIVESKPAAPFWGRDAELAILAKLLSQQRPLVQFIEGPPGIGKSALVRKFAQLSRSDKISAILLDCRSIEPTAQGLSDHLAAALECPQASLDAIYRTIGAMSGRVILIFDPFELFRLLNTWLREIFAPGLPENARMLLVSRQRMSHAWILQSPWSGFVSCLELEPLSESAALSYLGEQGLNDKTAKHVAGICRGHPLALTLAGTLAAEGRIEQAANSAENMLVAELSRFYLAGLEDPLLRRAIEAAALLRRLTRPLLQSVLRETSSDHLYDRLAALTLVDISADGLFLHDSVREAVAKFVISHDPEAARRHKQAAWRVLRNQIKTAKSSELWLYTADIIYLLSNPMVREAFFPDAVPHVVVVPARPVDFPAILAIIEQHEGKQGARWLGHWLEKQPRAFRVVRNDDDVVIGFYCAADTDNLEPEIIAEDPLAAAWDRHARETRMPASQSALFLRRWLSLETGEGPSAAQAACWLDIKRSYLELRPKLRRIYTAVHDLSPFDEAMSALGFSELDDVCISADIRLYQTAMLDLGPASVDGWLGGLLSRELGSQEEAPLDPDNQELLIGETRVHLTPLEFKLVQYLYVRSGKAVERGELLDDVWGQHYHGGSNVVDAVVASVRRKLGGHASVLQTVRGVGYRYDA